MTRFEASDRDRLARRHREEVEIPESREVSDLVMSLSADDSARRASAAWALAEEAATRPGQVPVSDLARATDDDDVWVRRGATWALAEVARSDPEAARSTVERATRLVGDDDPLVRENAVVTVASVATEHPRAAEPAIEELAALRDDDDGIVRRYTSEALRHVVDALSESTLTGEPTVVSVSDERLADVLDGANVVQTGGGGQSTSVRVAPASEVESAESGTADSRDADDEVRGRPPDPADVVSPDPVDAEYDEFERLRRVGTDPLTVGHKARVLAPGPRAHVVVTLRTLQESDHAAAFARATRRWERVDDHDHVAGVLARGDGPRPWVATEFFDAGTLADHLGDGVAASLWYGHRIVAAVAHAHALGVVHGGLRPGVVGVVETLGRTWPVPKVTDWEFGRVLAEAGTKPVSPAFAAPEHVAPETFGRPDQATDVYGLGALLYGLFAGRPPFTGDPHVVVQQVESADPPAPTESDADLPRAVDDVVARALAKRKPERYETVADLRVGLERVLEDRAPELLNA
ncbi:protein kinase domain-containing protein [Halomicrococcus sp. NG-SE-24]|uniref:protein kinase domain-containing protein n=1 Tax=Halomicrococcus sp. NG-SE-24 TaxID=3436928 RepID=UPI003D9770BC